MSKYDERKDINISVSRNDAYIVASELVRISEKYADKAQKLKEKGKCPGDKCMLADATINVANELLKVVKELDKILK